MSAVLLQLNVPLSIVLSGTRSEVVEKKLEEWRRAMEDRGLKINRKTTVYLRFNVDGNLDGNSDINLQPGTEFGTSEYILKIPGSDIGRK